MKLSVVIPYYNIACDLLSRCLTSVIEAGLSDYEIILVDDGSDEDVNEVKVHFRDNKNIIWLCQPHTGLGAARNNGINHAQGDFIFFLDSDDYIYPDADFPAILQHATETNCDILRFNYKFCTSLDRVNGIQPERIRFTPSADGDTYLSSHNLPGMACVYLFKRSLCQHIGLRFAETGFIEDEVFTTTLHTHAQSIIECNANVYAYYKRQDSITLTPSIERQILLIEFHLKAINEVDALYKSLRQKGVPSEGVKRKLDSLVVDIVRRIVILPDYKNVWNSYSSKLKEVGLYPLRNVNYTGKHLIFSKLANHTWGRVLLRQLLLHHIH